MSAAVTSESSEPPPGVVLAQMRKRAGLTGQQLGQMVRMSQAKISRIETGSTSASPEDVGRLARALGASRSVVDRLVEQTERSHNQMTDWRLPGGAVSSIQREVAAVEAGTREFRVFQPAIVVGLAQSSEYARAIFAAVQQTREPAIVDPGTSGVSEAVSARVRRQEILADPSRRFHFLMTESALGNRVVAPVFMLAQIQRLRELAAQENVLLKIIAADALLSFPPFHGFELLDDECVIIDVFNTSMMTRGSRDITSYRLVFDKLQDDATDNVSPILDRYQNIYRDLTA